MARSAVSTDLWSFSRRSLSFAYSSRPMVTEDPSADSTTAPGAAAAGGASLTAASDAAAGAPLEKTGGAMFVNVFLKSRRLAMSDRLNFVSPPSSPSSSLRSRISSASKSRFTFSHQVWIVCAALIFSSNMTRPCDDGASLAAPWDLVYCLARNTEIAALTRLRRICTARAQRTASFGNSRTACSMFSKPSAKSSE